MMAKHLLIIEEEKSIVAGLEKSLEPKGYVIYVADNVRHGFEVLNVLRIDGVFLSLELLEIHDFELLKELVSQYPRIPIIVMSARPSRELVLQTFAIGARGNISKPIVHEQLQEALFIFEGHLN